MPDECRSEALNRCDSQGCISLCGCAGAVCVARGILQRSFVESASYPGLKCSGQVCVGSGCTDCTILPGPQGADQVVVCGPGGRYPGRSTGGVALADSGRGQGALDTWALQSARQRPEGPSGGAAPRRRCSGWGGWQRGTGLGSLGSVLIITFVLQFRHPVCADSATTRLATCSETPLHAHKRCTGFNVLILRTSSSPPLHYRLLCEGNLKRGAYKSSAALVATPYLPHRYMPHRYVQVSPIKAVPRRY